VTFSCLHDVGRAISVVRDGHELVSYVYRPDDEKIESPRPYFHPMRTLDGALVTVYRPHDHVWHKGLAWSLPFVGEHNFWGGGTYVHGQGYVQLDNDGSMDHQRTVAFDVEPDVVRFRHQLVWHSWQGDPIVEEDRLVVIAPTSDPTAWGLVFDTTMTNVSGEPQPLGSPTSKGRENAGYGGLFWRGPRSFTDGRILAPQGSGADELRGQRASWMGFCGQHDEEVRSSSIVVVDDQGNLNHPPQWFVRSEQFAGVCPSPFFSEDVPFEPSQTMRFRYAVIVASGDSSDERAATLASEGEKLLTATSDR
jgi:hypothetical protein